MTNYSCLLMLIGFNNIFTYITVALQIRRAPQPQNGDFSTSGIQRVSVSSYVQTEFSCPDLLCRLLWENTTDSC